MKKSAVFAGAAVLVGDAVVLNMLYFTFAYLQTERLMNLGVVPWAPCALLLFLGNVLFLRKPRPLPAIAGLNLLGFAGMTALVFYHSEQVEGFLPVAFAVFFLILTAVRAFSVAMHSLTVSRMLTILGVHLLGLCFFALAQGGGGLPVEYNGILFAALIVEITALAFSAPSGTAGISCADRSGRELFCLPACSAHLLRSWPCFLLSSPPAREALPPQSPPPSAPQSKRRFTGCSG
jgi:hypothetical protein